MTPRDRLRGSLWTAAEWLAALGCLALAAWVYAL